MLCGFIQAYIGTLCDIWRHFGIFWRLQAEGSCMKVGRGVGKIPGQWPWLKNNTTHSNNEQLNPIKFSPFSPCAEQARKLQAMLEDCNPKL